MVLQSTESPPQIHWDSTGVAAFVPQLQVRVLDPVANIPRLLLRMGDDENDGWLLVYNAHQPASDKHDFTRSQRINFCEAIVRASNDNAKTEKNLIGFVLLGDAKCSVAQWRSVVWQSEMWLEGACVFRSGIRKDGDVIIAMGSNLMIHASSPMYFHCHWKGWTQAQRVLQSSHSNKVQLHVCRTRPQLEEGGASEHEKEAEDKDDDEEEGASEHEERRGDNDDFEPPIKKRKNN